MEVRKIAVMGLGSGRIDEFRAVSYTVFADGHLEVRLDDGATRSFAVEEWMDVDFVG